MKDFFVVVEVKSTYNIIFVSGVQHNDSIFVYTVTLNVGVRSADSVLKNLHITYSWSSISMVPLYLHSQI